MRHIHLLALSAAVLAATATAGAQDKKTEPQPTKVPAGRTFMYDTGDRQASRAALGVVTSSTGTARDTLGLMITRVTVGGPAEKAGLEEGNRISAINGLNLRANAADLEDYETGNTLSRRLVRELSKAKPGDEVELRVYRDGRSQAVKVKTVDSDSLFRRTTITRTVSREDMDNRPALGFGIGSSGSRRDTLGVLLMMVQDSTPASRAGLEEGNRIAAINGVNLRVSREDADDPSAGQAKSARLHREVSQLKPGDNVTIRVYSNGQFRDVTMKVARAGDLPHSRNARFGWSADFFPPMPPMSPSFSMPAVPPVPPSPRVQMYRGVTPIGLEFDWDPALFQQMNDVRMQIEELRPELEKIRSEVPRVLEKVVPAVRVRMGGGISI